MATKTKKISEKLFLLIGPVQLTTKRLMLLYNDSIITGHKIDYCQTNKALNQLARQGRILKNIESRSKVYYFIAED